MVRPFRAQSSLWTGTQGVALGARNAPLGLNTSAHPYCTGSFFLIWIEKLSNCRMGTQEAMVTSVRKAIQVAGQDRDRRDAVAARRQGAGVGR